jgi:hypothetical protein
MTDAVLLIIVAGTVAIAVAIDVVALLGFALDMAQRIANLIEHVPSERRCTPTCAKPGSQRARERAMASHPPIRPP